MRGALLVVPVMLGPVGMRLLVYTVDTYLYDTVYKCILENRRIRTLFSIYSWHHKSAYTHLHFCGLAHCCASPTDTCISVIMPLGIAHQMLQPQLLRFPAMPSQIQILSQARLQVTSKKADAVSSLSQSH